MSIHSAVNDFFFIIRKLYIREKWINSTQTVLQDKGMNKHRLKSTQLVQITNSLKSLIHAFYHTHRGVKNRP